MARPTRQEIAGMRKHIDSADEKELFRLLHTLYEQQTEWERQWSLTGEKNEVGFNSYDGPILSGIAQRAERYGSLTPRQADLVRRKLKKYARQLVQLRMEACQ